MATDAQLMERLRTDATGEALRELYRTYSSELFGFAVNALGERGAAEELVQEVFTRAWPAARAAEAAGLQGRFWEMHDALFADQGRLEDPHLWDRAERLGLDVARFDADRRSEAVEARIAADWRAGVRAGVATTPTLFAGGARFAGRAALNWGQTP